MREGQAERDRWDQAVDEEVDIENVRARWEIHRRVSGDDSDYRYPDRSCGPGAGQHPPPRPAEQE